MPQKTHIKLSASTRALRHQKLRKPTMRWRKSTTLIQIKMLAQRKNLQTLNLHMSYSTTRRRNRHGIHMVLRRLIRAPDSIQAAEQVLPEDHFRDSGVALVQPSTLRTCLVPLQAGRDEAAVAVNLPIKKRYWLEITLKYRQTYPLWKLRKVFRRTYM